MIFSNIGLSLTLIAVSVLLPGSVSRQSVISVVKEARQESVAQTKTDLDAELARIVSDAAEGEGNPSALAKLQGMPRTELYRSLNRVRRGLSSDDALRVKIAFVSCELNFDYLQNREILLKSLVKNHKYERFSPDEAASLISGLLMVRRDARLLQVLMTSVDWADGALAEELSSTFAKRVVVDTEMFLTALKLQPLIRRQKAYRLVRGGELSADERNALLRHLSVIPRTSRLRPIAIEMLRSVS